MKRRIIKYCEEKQNFAKWTGDNSHLSGYYSFGQERCGKVINTISRHEYSGDEDYIPLLRDAFGRITPVGSNLELRTCGHNVYTWESKKERDSKRTPLWSKLLPFQQTAIEQIEENDLSGYCCYDTGTGKTIIGTSIIRENFAAMTPALIICEAGDVYRWEKEATKFGGSQEYFASGNLREALKRIPQVLTDDTKEARVGSVVIVSWTQLKKEAFQKWLFHFKFKSIIADEGHMFKDENASRTRAFIEACSFIPNKIFLSATWLENKILEAFVPLNILAPTDWPSRRNLTYFCIKSANGKTYSLDPYLREAFLTKISPYVFRLTKEEAGLKFPIKHSMHADPYSRFEKLRQPMWYSPAEYQSNMGVITEYNLALDKLEEEINMERGKFTFTNIIGLMSHIRHITGKMKIAHCAEQVFNWLMFNNNKEKICVGVHHKAVMQSLKELLELAGYKVLTMSDELPAKKDEIEAEWRDNPENRILLASILGAGKGRNFQFCKYAIALERQWNKSKELQFEGRFHRTMFDKDDNLRTEFTEEDDVIIDYIMARDTFDEYFDEMVKLKGEIVNSADLALDDTADEDFILELAYKMVMKRIKYTGVFI